MVSFDSGCKGTFENPNGDFALAHHNANGDTDVMFKDSK